MDEEKKKCYFCGTEEFLRDALWNGEYLDLCDRCIGINNAIELRKPTIEQLSRVAKGITLHDHVKAWRKERETTKEEVNLDSLRERKQEIKKEEAKIQEENVKRNIENGQSMIDLRSKEITINDLKRMHEEQKAKNLLPRSIRKIFQRKSVEKVEEVEEPKITIKEELRQEPKQETKPWAVESVKGIEAETELKEFMTEVEKIKQEERELEQLELEEENYNKALKELEAPRPIEPLEHFEEFGPEPLEQYKTKESE